MEVRCMYACVGQQPSMDACMFLLCVPRAGNQEPLAG